MDVGGALVTLGAVALGGVISALAGSRTLDRQIAADSARWAESTKIENRRREQDREIERTRWQRNHLIEIGARFVAQLQDLDRAEGARAEAALLHVAEQFDQAADGTMEIEPSEGEETRLFWAQLERQREKDGQPTWRDLVPLLHEIQMIAPDEISQAARETANGAALLITADTPEGHETAQSAMLKGRMAFIHSVQNWLSR